jgi:Tol biopolymer transport system component
MKGYGQDPEPFGSLKIRYDFDNDILKKDEWLQTAEAVSPDGHLLAHFVAAYPPGLYVKGLSTGEDTLIVPKSADLRTVDGMTFSPDGSHLIFNWRSNDPTRAEAPGRISIVNIDGTNLKDLGQEIPIEPSQLQRTDFYVSDDPYSNDGKKLAVTTFYHSEVGPSITSTIYVGDLSDEHSATFQKIGNGLTKSWDEAESSIYYYPPDGRGVLCKLDLNTQDERVAYEPLLFQNILGGVPGTDRVYVDHLDFGNCHVANSTVGSLDLDSPTAEMKPAQFVEGEPLNDPPLEWIDRFHTESATTRDGRLRVHSEEQGLFITDLKTGKDTEIVGHKDDLFNFGEVALSPDARQIVFSVCPGVGAACRDNRVYKVGIDGSNLTRLGGDEERHIYQNVTHPSFSPDGRKIMFLVTTRMKEDGDHYYVGILSNNEVNQFPRKLVDGRPAFWGPRGQSIYYVNTGGLCRFNLRTGQSMVIRQFAAASQRRMIGRLPATNTDLYLGNEETDDCRDTHQVIEPVNLDGNPISVELRKVLASIPMKDAEGNDLVAIRPAGPHQLFLLYWTWVGGNGVDIKKRHAQIIEYP